MTILPWIPDLRRVRAAAAPGDWNPTDLGASLVAAWDINDLGTIWSDPEGTTPAVIDDHVERVDDISGNGHNLTTFASSGLVLKKDGNDAHYIEMLGSQVYLHDAPASKAAVCMGIRHVTVQSGYRGLFALTGQMMLLANNGADKWGTFDGGDRSAGTTLAADTPYVLTMTGGSSGNFRTNGAADGTYSSTSGQSNHLGGASGQNPAFHLYRCVVATTFGSQLDDAEAWANAAAGAY